MGVDSCVPGFTLTYVTVPTHTARSSIVAVYRTSKDALPSLAVPTAMSTTSSKPAGPCHSRTAFTSITSKSRKNASFGSNPMVSNHRVQASSKYVSQWALNTTPWASTSAYRGRTRWTNATRSASQLAVVLTGGGLDATPADLPHLVVSERPVRGSEPQREGEALSPLAERVRPEDIEQPDLFEDVTGGAAQGLGHVSGRDALVHDECEVDRRRRVRGERPERAIAAATVEQPIEIELQPDDRRRELERDDQRRVELPHDSDLAAVDEDSRGAVGIEAGSDRCFGLAVRDLDRVEDLVQHVHHVEEVDGTVGLDRPPTHRARQRDGEVRRLFGQQRSRAARREENAPDLEKADVGEAVGVVVGDAAQEPGKDPRAEDRLLGAERVGRFDEPVERGAGLFEVSRRHERDRDGLGQPGADERVRDPAPLSLSMGERSEERR